MGPGLRAEMAQWAFASPEESNTPSTFKELVVAETERWNGVLRTRNIQPLH
jgi:hypothetical protein